MLSIFSLMIAANMVTAPTHAEQAADVLNQYNLNLKQATSVVGSYYISAEGSQSYFGKVDFRLGRDNKLALLTSNSEEYFNGTSHYVVDKVNKTYQLRDPRISGVPYLAGFEGFRVVDKILDEKSLSTPGQPTNAKVAGKDVVRVPYGTGNDVYDVFLDPKSAIPIGYDYTVGGTKYTVRYQNVVMNAPLKADAFEYVPASFMREVPFETAGLLPVGTMIRVSEDVEVASQFKKIQNGKKAMIVAFVRTNEAASIDLIKEMNAMAKSAPKSLGIVAIASSKDIARYLGREKLQFPVIVETDIRSNTLRNTFKVLSYPTIYLLDEEGVVAHRQVGGSPALLSGSLSKLGVTF